MLRQFVAVLAGSAILAASSPVSAQDEGAVVPSLVVSALDRGPAWWKVSNGDSVVVIMGAPMGPLPEKTKWDHGPLEKRIKGARALILPAAPEWNLGTLFQLWGLRKQVRADAPLSALIPAGDYERFKAVAAEIDKPMSQYEKFDPAIAGLQLYGQYLAHYDLNGRDSTERAAESLARRFNVPIQRGKFKLGEAIKTAVADSNQTDTSAACVHDILEGVSQEPAKFRAAAEGWTVGDVGKAIDLSDGPNRCWMALFGGTAKVSLDSQMAAIDAALQTPGKTVALVPMRQLVVSGGVLEQLRAKGYVIVDPTKRLED